MDKDGLKVKEKQVEQRLTDKTLVMMKHWRINENQRKTENKHKK